MLLEPGEQLGESVHQEGGGPGGAPGPGVSHDQREEPSDGAG